MSRLRLPKNFLVNSSSREVSTMNDEVSIVGVVSEVLPYSNTGEQGQCDKTSDGDPGGGGDPDGLGIVMQRTSCCRGRALTLDASFILHQWLADDKKGKNPKASKGDGCKMIIGIRWRVNL
jgi:hypothetical protein